MEVEGRVKVVFETQTFNSGFQKREFVLTTKEQYPQDVKFELIKEKIDLIDPYQNGDEIKVHFNLRGNEYNGKYFVNLQAWRIEAANGGAKTTSPGRDPFEDAGFPDAPTSDVSEDDLPF
jgi:single-strand DNA-binding protein